MIKEPPECCLWCVNSTLISSRPKPCEVEIPEGQVLLKFALQFRVEACRRCMVDNPIAKGESA